MTLSPTNHVPVSARWRSVDSMQAEAREYLDAASDLLAEIDKHAANIDRIEADVRAARVQYHEVRDRLTTERRLRDRAIEAARRCLSRSRDALWRGL